MALLNARQAREANEVLVDLGDGSEVRARKEDMTLLVFDGRVPMPLLAAVQRMIDLPGATDAERLEALGSDNGRDLVRVLREHVANVLIEPRCSAVDTGDPDVLPATYFSVPQLMAIWTATAVVPKVTVGEAQRFREGASADDAPPAPNGTAVLSAAESVGGARTIERIVTG